MPDNCPRCQRPAVHHQSATGASIDHHEASQARTCIVMDPGAEEFTIYYHTDENLVEAAHKRPPTPDDVPDPTDLTAPHSSVFKLILEATTTGGTIQEGELLGKALDVGATPDEIRDAARDLVSGGYVESPTDAVYKVREGVSI